MEYTHNILHLLSGMRWDRIILLAICALASLAMPALEAWQDSNDFPVPINKSKAYHTRRFICRSVAACVMIVNFGLVFLPLYCFYFWIVFDASYNYFTGRPLFYVGATAKTDKLFKGKTQFIIKALGLILSIAIIFI